jgi:hypothetical protein
MFFLRNHLTLLQALGLAYVLVPLTVETQPSTPELADPCRQLISYLSYFTPGDLAGQHLEYRSNCSF